MGLFGNKKPSETDTGQDTQIKQLWAWIDQLNKNQTILIKNNNSFIKQIGSLEKAVKTLQDVDLQHEATFQKMQSILDALSKVTEQTES